MATTNMLQWNPTSTNQENDAAYLADSQRAGGAPNGSILASATANKLFFQCTTYLDALFTAFANKGFTTSDSNLSTLTAQCANFLTSADVLPGALNVAYAASVAFNAAVANGFYVTSMTGNLTISAITGLTLGQLVTLGYQQDSTGGRTVTFPSVLVGAVQPDPTANAVSLQVFWYDSTTSKLRALTPLMSSNGAFFSAALTLPGLLTAGSLTLAAGAPAGQVLTGNGTIFTPQPGVANRTRNSSSGNTFGAQYQNSTLYPRTVAVSGLLNIGHGAGQTVTIQALVGTSSANVVVATASVTNGSGYCTVTFEIMPGEYYVVNTGGIGAGDTGPATLASWTEWNY